MHMHASVKQYCSCNLQNPMQRAMHAVHKYEGGSMHGTGATMTDIPERGMSW